MEMKRNTAEMLGLMLAIAASVVTCAPTTRPLEHSPSELAWDAWLQQGSRQAAPPRRITTKSLFVFPHLGPESLPACADGYRPDSMGRCVKVVKVDETAHLEFLLQKLNSQFATETSEGQDEAYDYDIESESSDTSGPFQFNIPLALQASGTKQDRPETSDEIVLITKKQPDSSKPPTPDKEPTREKNPTSSPEVAPEYDNEKNQFFLDKASAEAEGLIQQNNPASSEPVSILLRNSTNTGLTLLTSGNGKFENVTSDDDKIQAGVDVLIKELEDAKDDKVKKEEAETTAADPMVDAPAPETIILQTSFSNNPNQKLNNDKLHEKDETKKSEKSDVNSNAGGVQSSNLNSSSVDNNSDVNIKSENHVSLVSQIEALKVEQEVGGSTNAFKNETSTENNMVDTSSKHGDTKPHKSTSLPTGVSPAYLDTEELTDAASADIEEKIKKISRLADVSRNTEGPNSNNGIGLQKKTSGDFIRFPSTQSSNGETSTDLNKAASSSTLFQFPPEYTKTPFFPSYVSGGNTAPLLYQESQPLTNYQKEHMSVQDSSEVDKPFWLPYGWNVNNPSGEHNLMELWSRMSSMQRYPYNVRFEQDRHPPRHHSLYPSPHAPGAPSGRHTPGNFRQGRDDGFRTRQDYRDGSLPYKRSRHPHFRESQDLSRILESFNGR